MSVEQIYTRALEIQNKNGIGTIQIAIAIAVIESKINKTATEIISEIQALKSKFNGLSFNDALQIYTAANVQADGQGAKGDQGIQGEKGEQGDQGIQGIQGEKGEQGDQGIQGERGELAAEGNSETQ